MEIINILLAVETVLALSLFIISFMAARREGIKKLYVLSSAFGIFFIKSLYFSWIIFTQELEDIKFLLESTLADMIILVIMFISSISR